jgi:hypothetical protein
MLNKELWKQVAFFLIIASTMFMSCNSGETDVNVPDDVAALDNVAVYAGEMEPLNDISFEPVARFGDTDSIFISRVSGIAVADDRSLFLSDRSEAVIHVYDGAGEYRESIGRRGEGPGEFQTIVQPELSNGNLFVLDLDQQRISVFDAENYTFRRSFSLGDKEGIRGRPLSMELIPDERILALYSGSERDGNRLKRTETPAILDNEGNVISSGFVTLTENNRLLVESNGMFQIFSMPFLGQHLVDVTGNGEIVTGFTDRFLLHYLSFNGDTLRSIYHDIAPPLLDRQALLNNMESEPIRRELSSMDMPDTRQAFNSLRVDDENRLWVSSPTEDTDVYTWRILADTGEMLSQFDKPASSSLQFVKDGFAYFLETDEETGVTDVVKYRFTLQ